MKVIDSSGWIEYMADGQLAELYAPYVAGAEELVTPAIVLYEVYKRTMIREGTQAAEKAASMILKTKIAPLDEELAVIAAGISIRHKLPMADSIIYATARLHAATLVTSDAHFEGLPGVEFIARETAG